MTSAELSSNQSKCSPESANSVLVLRRSLLPEPHEEQEDVHKSYLFHSNGMMKIHVCSFIIDSVSCTNACSLAMVDTLLQKYALVNFKVGNCRDALPMTTCSYYCLVDHGKVIGMCLHNGNKMSIQFWWELGIYC